MAVASSRFQMLLPHCRNSESTPSASRPRSPPPRRRRPANGGCCEIKPREHHDLQRAKLFCPGSNAFGTAADGRRRGAGAWTIRDDDQTACRGDPCAGAENTPGSLDFWNRSRREDSSRDPTPSTGGFTSLRSTTTPSPLYAPLPLTVLRRTDLPASAKLIYARLKLYTGNNGTAYPFVTTLADECGITRRQIMRSVAKLEEVGLVTVQRTFGTGNRYHLTSAQNVTSVENVTSDKNSTTPVTKETLPPVTKTTPPPVTKRAHRKEVLKRGIEKKSEKINVVVVPDSLSVPSFLEAWEKFQQHRREIRKPLTPTAAGSLLKKLAGWGADRAVAAIEHSVANGWTGIFEPSTTGPSRPGHRNQPPTTEASDHAKGF